MTMTFWSFLFTLFYSLQASYCSSNFPKIEFGVRSNPNLQIQDESNCFKEACTIGNFVACRRKFEAKCNKDQLQNGGLHLWAAVQIIA